MDASVKFSYLPTPARRCRHWTSVNLPGCRSVQVAAPLRAGSLASEQLAEEFRTSCSPVYFISEALLALHQGPQAAANSRRFLDHRGIVVSDPDWCVRSLPLGLRLRFMQMGRARSAGLLELWKES